MIDVDEVLEQLDLVWENHGFPDLNHPYYYAIDCRLHAYGDGVRWALVGETVGYSWRGFNAYDVLHYFGNCLTLGAPGFESDDFLPRVENHAEINQGADWDAFVTGSTIRVRGRELTANTAQGGNIVAALRSLVPDHRDLFLGTEAELRRRIPADIPQLLQLEEWHQPDLFETAPSETETFRQLAQVMATCDPAAYRPTEPPNTHWSNWPLSGSL